MELTVTSLLISCLTGFVAYLFWSTRRPPNYPPGQFIVPYIGTILSMENPNKTPFHYYFNTLSKKYGGIFSIAIGSNLIIVINKYSLLKKALVDNGGSFASRPHRQYRMSFYNPNRIGIGDAPYTPEFKAQRMTSMSILKSLGYAKTTIENKIQQECQALVETISQKDGEAFDPRVLVGITVANVTCFLLYGKRFDYDDPEFVALTNAVRKFLFYLGKDLKGDFIPLLRLLPSHRDSINNFRNVSIELLEFIRKQIEISKQNLMDRNPEEEHTSFIEAYLDEIRKAEQGKSKLNENWIVNIISDSFIAGIDTSSTTLYWAILFMIHNPDIQEKIHKELDQVFGENNEGSVPIDYQNRLLTPYTEATILEVQRKASIAAFALPHATTEKIHFEGYDIPEGSEVWFNLYQVSHDPELWNEPEVFRPERFLDDSGKVEKPEYHIPFSMGRRSCMGELLAKQELYIMFAFLMKHFKFSNPPDQVLPSLEPIKTDSIREAQSYTVCADRRYK